MPRFLIKGPTLKIQPSLAQKIGLNEAIFIQQTTFLTGLSKHIRDNERWIYNTYNDWAKQFPFWSKRTIERIIYGLEEKQLLLSTTKFNTFKNDYKKWYRVNEQQLAKITGVQVHSNMLIEEYPIFFLPSLAVKFGLNEAIFLQQLQYWNNYSEKYQEDTLWVVKSHEKWLSEFTFWSLSTLKRTIGNLTKQGVIYNTDKYNESKMVKTRWLAINYERVPELKTAHIDEATVQSDEANTIAHIDEATVQSDEANTIAHIDEATVQSDEANTIAHIDEATVQSDEANTIAHIDEATVQSDELVSSSCRARQLNLTKHSIYTETDPETDHKTERLTEINDHHSDNFSTDVDNFVVNDGVSLKFSTTVEKKHAHGDLIPSVRKEEVLSNAQPCKKDYPPLKNEISASLDKFIDLYVKYVIGAKQPTRKVKPYFDKVEKIIAEHGEEGITSIFDEIKESDFLLGVLNFKPRLPWLLDNYDKILSGKYANENTPSKYKLAQACNAENDRCKPTQDSRQPDIMCRYCIRWKQRESVQDRTHTPQESAAICGKNKCVLKPESRVYEHCKYCSQSGMRHDNVTKQKTEAEKCYNSCKGMCAVKILKTEANDYCIYCPGNKPPRGTKTKKRESAADIKSSSTIQADRNDSGDIWAKAFEFFEEKKKTIQGRIRKYMPFTTYTEEDLLDEALMVAYETLVELIAADDNVKKSLFMSHYWINLAHSFTKYQTIPAMCDVMGKTEKDNKTACTFYEIKPEENDFSEIDETNASETFELFDDKFLKALLSVLPLKEEQVMEYYLELTEFGKLSNPEIALKIGCHKSHVRHKIDSAMKILERFVKEYKINPDSDLEYIEKCAEKYSKRIFPKISSYGVFEIGSLLKKVI